MTSNEELIAEARAIGGCKGCELHGPSMIHQLADALESAQGDLVLSEASRVDAIAALLTTIGKPWGRVIDEVILILRRRPVGPSATILSRVRAYGEELLTHHGQTWDALHGRKLLSILEEKK